MTGEEGHKDSDGSLRLVMLGRQGSGKGTQAQRISALYQVPHISTGDAFRAAVQAGSAVGLEARSYLDRGELVPDEVTIGVLRERLDGLTGPGGTKGGGFILDGFPRNLAQARALDVIVDGRGLDLVVKLEAAIEEVLKRLSARRVCNNCGAVYNLVDHPPEVPGKCDVCGGVLSQREDDTEAAIRRRLEIYESETAPVASWYQEKGLLAVVDAAGSPDEVTRPIVVAIEAALGRRGHRP